VKASKMAVVFDECGHECLSGPGNTVQFDWRTIEVEMSFMNHPGLHLHREHICIMKIEQHNIIKLKKVNNYFLIQWNQEGDPFEEDPVPLRKDESVEIQYRLRSIVKHHITI
jgi:hypothetical protein